MDLKNYLIVLCGPTGIGKTRIGVELAKRLDCEIISADSRQFFKEMKIGTAVPSDEELLAVRHHFIQSHSIHQPYNASRFEEEVIQFLDEYYSKKSIIILAGGSGLYIDAVCKGIDNLPSIDPEIREKWAVNYKTKGLEFIRAKVAVMDPDYYREVDVNNPKRLLKAIEVFEMTGLPYSGFLKHEPKQRNFKVVKIGLDTQRKRLYEQINRRVDSMISNGLIDEARALYPFKQLTPLNTVGYRELFAHFDGDISLEEAVEQIRNHSRAYARRQLTWFRRDKDIKWFEPGEVDGIIKYIDGRKIK
jgi:tRNA dimethylallyltransferase